MAEGRPKGAAAQGNGWAGASWLKKVPCESRILQANFSSVTLETGTCLLRELNCKKLEKAEQSEWHKHHPRMPRPPLTREIWSHAVEWTRGAGYSARTPPPCCLCHLVDGFGPRAFGHTIIFLSASGASTAGKTPEGIRCIPGFRLYCCTAPGISPEQHRTTCRSRTTLANGIAMHASCVLHFPNGLGDFTPTGPATPLVST